MNEFNFNCTLLRNSKYCINSTERDNEFPEVIAFWVIVSYIYLYDSYTLIVFKNIINESDIEHWQSKKIITMIFLICFYFLKTVEK